MCVHSLQRIYTIFLKQVKVDIRPNTGSRRCGSSVGVGWVRLVWGRVGCVACFIWRGERGGVGGVGWWVKTRKYFVTYSTNIRDDCFRLIACKIQFEWEWPLEGRLDNEQIFILHRNLVK